MALIPDNTLITATPEEGRALAIMIARKTIGAIQPDAEVRGELRPAYANDADSLTAAGHVVAFRGGDAAGSAGPARCHAAPDLRRGGPRERHAVLTPRTPAGMMGR